MKLKDQQKDSNGHQWVVPYYTRLQWLFFFITIVGCLADIVLMANAFTNLGIGDEQGTGVIRVPLGDGLALTLPSALLQYGLAVIVCALSVAFMFKAGSARTEGKSTSTVLFIAVWITLGFALVSMRLIIEVRHINALSGEGTIALNPLALLLDPEGQKELIIAVILFILFIGTGISAYLAGKSIGNSHINALHHMQRKISREQKRLGNLLAKNYNEYLACQTILALGEQLRSEVSSLLATRNNNIEVAIQDLVVKKFALVGIVVDEEILPVRRRARDFDDEAF